MFYFLFFGSLGVLFFLIIFSEGHILYFILFGKSEINFVISLIAVNSKFKKFHSLNLLMKVWFRENIFLVSMCSLRIFSYSHKKTLCFCFFQPINYLVLKGVPYEYLSFSAQWRPIVVIFDNIFIYFRTPTNSYQQIKIFNCILFSWLILLIINFFLIFLFLIRTLNALIAHDLYPRKIIFILLN